MGPQVNRLPGPETLSGTGTAQGLRYEQQKYPGPEKTEQGHHVGRRPQADQVGVPLGQLRVGTGDATAAVVNVEYLLYNGRYAPVQADSVITD